MTVTAPAGTITQAVECADLSYQFATHLAVDHVNLSIAPGETARFMSWEISRESASHAWSDQAPLAEQAADDLMDAPLSTLYQGLSPAQIATIRNWAPPAVDGGIAAVPGASAATATNLHAVGIDYGASALSSCGSGTLEWDFGDGGHDTGTLVSHRFAAGTATQLDVFESQVALTDAKLNQLQAYYSYNVAVASVRRSMGLTDELHPTQELKSPN